MNILFSTVGRRGYIIDYFRKHLNKTEHTLVASSDRDNSKQEYTSGFFYCDKSYIVPSIKNEEEYVNRLLDICKIEKIDALLSFYDLDSFVLSKYLKEFKSIGVQPIISSFEVNQISFDKLETYKFLKNNNFNTPLTLSAKEALSASKISFPVVVKSRFGFGSNFVHIAKNKNEMIFFINYNPKEELIVQEFLKGDEYSFDICNDLDGKTITSVVKKKIKMRAGETDQGYAIKDKSLLDTAYMLGNKLKHIGPIDVDFFIVNDKPFILEINPRFGGGYPITHLAGVDFPLLIIKMINNTLETNYEQYQDYKEGNVMIKDIKILEAKGI